MKNSNKQVETKADFFLDITSEVCPMTFVKTKLLIEKMSPGQTAEVLLKGREPLENVPRNIIDHGHTLVSLAKTDDHQPEDGLHRLVLQKN